MSQLISTFVGMVAIWSEGFSQSLVPFQPVCVRCELLVDSGQPTSKYTRTDNSSTDHYCGAIVQLGCRAGVPSRGQRLLLTQRTTSHANITQGESLIEDGASLPSGTNGTHLKVVILPSRLVEGY